MQFVSVGKLAGNIKGDIGGKRFAKFPVLRKECIVLCLTLHKSPRAMV